MSTPLGPPWRGYVATRWKMGASRDELAGPLADAWRCGAAAMLDAAEAGRIVEARDELARWVRDAGGTITTAGRLYGS